MGRRRSGDRILGPYWDAKREKWRMCVCRRGQPDEWSNLPDSVVDREAAEAFLEDAREGLPTVKVGILTDTAVREYLDHKKKTLAPGSLAADRAATLPFRLRFGALPVQELRPKHVEIYLRDIASKKLATQRSYFMALGRMTSWWEALGYTSRDLAAETVARRRTRDDALPWVGKAAARKLGRGKAQLRNYEEYVAYLEAALTEPNPERRIGAAMPALTGARAGELLHVAERADP